MRPKIAKALKVVHIITDLDLGGAEMMLLRLAAKSQAMGSENFVISLRELGPISSQLTDAGIPVWSLNMQTKLPNPLKVLELTSLINKIKPTIIQTWMYHADLMGGIAAKLAGSIPVIWGIRNSTLDPQRSNPRTIRLVKTNAGLADWLAAGIISNSKIAADIHIDLGFPAAKIKVIPNGFDLTEFAPNQKAYVSLREGLGLATNAFIVGLLGRFDPQKDHASFVEAAALLNSKHEDAHFLLAGTDVNWDNTSLAAQINKLGLAKRFHLLGPRKDIPDLMAGLDILASSSAYGESFPNVVGEAMASGVPCVVTDVGDSAAIVGTTGFSVPPRDPAALAAVIEKIILMSQEKRKELGRLARQRIRDHFSLEQMITSYQDYYVAILDAA